MPKVILLRLLLQCERVGHYLLHLSRGKHLAESRHLAQAIDDEVGAAKLVEIALGQVVGPVEAALAVGPMAAHAVFLEDGLPGQYRRRG